MTTQPRGEPNTSVSGWVAPGYELVRDAFAANIAELGAGGGAYSVCVGGQPVVDIWGGEAQSGVPWAEDTISVVMSTTKGMATICAQILYDRGLLDVEAPVTQYWPEFGQAGKEKITVRHVLTHTSGVLGFGRQRPPVSWDGTGWDDYDAIAAGLAAAPAWWTPGEKFGYHATTYGWLVGEIVRRISGMTVGQFFRREVAEALGLDIHIGTPPELHHRVATLHDQLRDGAPLPVRILMKSAAKKMHNPMTLAGQAFLADGETTLLEQGENLLNNKKALAAELPFGNGTASARSLARVYAVHALGGELDGLRLFSKEAVEKFAAQQISMPDEMMLQMAPPGTRWLMKTPVRRTLGYLLNPFVRNEKPRFGPNPNSYGHDGAGGQLAYCDPDNGLSFGFVRSQMSSDAKFSLRLINRTYECAGSGTQWASRTR